MSVEKYIIVNEFNQTVIQMNDSDRVNLHQLWYKLIIIDYLVSCKF